MRTIAQVCRAISPQIRHISIIGKKLVKQQYLLHTSWQYGERQPTNSWDRFTSLGHPCKFQRVWRLGSVTARHSSRWASAKLCGVEQRAPPIFGRAAITLGIGPHSSLFCLVPCGRLSWLVVSFWAHVNIVHRIVTAAATSLTGGQPNFARCLAVSWAATSTHLRSRSSHFAE